MLVLSRKQNERVVIGDRVTVTVVAIRGKRVVLSFDGPSELPIHREEVRERIVADPPALRLVGCA